MALMALLCGCVSEPAETTSTTTTTLMAIECSVDGDCIPAVPLVGAQYYCDNGVCKTRALGNPASMKCAADGGETRIIDSTEGQYGVCLLPDGSVCEEWAYFNGNCTAGDCIVYCRNVGYRSEGWYDCYGKLIYYDNCGGNRTGDELIDCAPFEGVDACTSDYVPVCGKIESTIGAEWRTFGNACTACTTALTMGEVVGYTQGPC